jgi:hypothetical protein
VNVDLTGYSVDDDGDITYETPCGFLIDIGCVEIRNGDPVVTLNVSRDVPVSQLHKITHLAANWTAQQQASLNDEVNDGES